MWKLSNQQLNDIYEAINWNPFHRLDRNKEKLLCPLFQLLESPYDKDHIFHEIYHFAEKVKKKL